jgi:Squalene-hopene cyclase N-terminal domain
MRGRFVLISLFFCGAPASTLCAGDKQPAAADVRQAIERGLPFIEKDALAWIKRRDCMSCHVVPFMLWSHNEAQARGVQVDAIKLAEWNDWSMGKSLEQRAFFKLPGKVVETFPEPIRPKLTDLIDVGFAHEMDYVGALGKSLAPEELKQHQPALLKQATLPKKGGANDGGGLDTMTQLLLGRDPEAGGKKADQFYAGIVELLLRWQEADGTWKAAGQLPSRRWPRPAADQTTKMWNILALSSYGTPSPAVQKSLEKAHAVVKKGKGDANFEWLVARVLYDHKFGSAEELATRRKELLKRQNTDGGWSVLPGQKSEAFSTGQALYALHLTGSPPNDAPLAKGQQFLLKTQQPDGSWITSPADTSTGGPDRLKKLEPIYRFWGSAWAVIGLSRSLAEK